MDARIDLFRDLLANIWFHVMNWVLGELVAPNPQQKKMQLIGHCFYFNAKDLKQHRRFRYELL